MRKHITYQQLFRFLSTGLILIGLSVQAQTQTLDSCKASQQWFPHSNTPRPNDAAFQSASNCEFHQWSWQMFLWLTQDVNNKPRFLSFNSPQSLLGMNIRGMLPRKTKHMLPQSFDEYLQAGTDGILVDHAGKAVYYSQYINPTFEDFIKTNQLTDHKNVLKMDPNTQFPIENTKGAMELKVSWKVVAKGEDTKGMFTMETEVAKLINTNDGIKVDPNQTTLETLALVGFHIGGIVNGHPEMIWATFEHNKNSPSVKPGTTLEQAVSEQDFTFYNKGTILGKCNINPSISGLKLDEKSQTLSPVTQVCLQYQFGNAEGVNEGNTQNIMSLNKAVESQLDSQSIWRNYREVGAIWFLQKNALEPGLRLDTDSFKNAKGDTIQLTGSLKLSNSMIETFTQRQSTMDNCFRCHNTSQEFPPSNTMDPLPATNLNISHAFQNIYFWSQEKTSIQALLSQKGETK
jgi:hypothetical protein